MDADIKEGRSTHSSVALIFLGFSVFYAFFFSPVLFGGREFLSDGQLSAFYSDITLWSDAWAGGWPSAADLTQMMFSPLRHLFRHLPYGFNLFVLTSYALVSSFMFGYVFYLTRSHSAGIVSGLTFGLSGFMMAHLGHTGIVAGVTWMPLLLWTLERLRLNSSPLWIGIGAVSICAMFLSGHPQLTVYSYIVGAAYSFFAGFGAKQCRKRYWLASLGVFAIGVGLAAFQWVPTYELSKETFRSSFSYSEFTSYSLPLRQIPMLLFPFLFGSQYGLFGNEYFGAESYTELTGYFGAVALVLAIVALSTRLNRVSTFWGITAVAAILLSLGGSLPWLAKFVYHVPILNQFRVPGRNIYELCLAISVLAGLGMAALQRGNVSTKSIRIAALTALHLSVLFTVIAVAVHYNITLTNRPTETLGLTSAIFVPLIWITLSISALFLYMSRRFPPKYISLIMVVLVGADMTSFGWFHEWRISPSIENRFIECPVTNRYAKLARDSQQKLISSQGSEIPPDKSRLSGLPSLNWYGPLLLKRYSELTGINTGGKLAPDSLTTNNVALDLFGGRYLFAETPETRQLFDIKWTGSPLELIMGNGCGNKLLQSRLITLPTPFAADCIAIVSQMGCSTQLADGELVAELLIRDLKGNTEKVALRAGKDTSEWAIDCQDVSPIMKHKKAPIFESSIVVRPGTTGCEAHTFITQLVFDPISIISVEIIMSAEVHLNLHHITLFDQIHKKYRPISFLDCHAHHVLC